MNPLLLHSNICEHDSKVSPACEPVTKYRAAHSSHQEPTLLPEKKRFFFLINLIT